MLFVRTVAHFSIIVPLTKFYVNNLFVFALFCTRCIWAMCGSHSKFLLADVRFPRDSRRAAARRVHCRACANLASWLPYELDSIQRATRGDFYRLRSLPRCRTPASCLLCMLESALSSNIALSERVLVEFWIRGCVVLHRCEASFCSQSLYCLPCSNCLATQS